MWAGQTTRVAIPNLNGVELVPRLNGGANLVLREITNHHTPSLLKSFDELIVNTADIAVETALKGGKVKDFTRVSYINIEFDPRSGAFTIENDGPGIPIAVHQAISKKHGRPIYIPEIAFCHLLSGSNLEKAADNVKGGTNGVGAKIANINGEEFDVETVAYDTDGSKLLYRQKCLDRMKVINPPQIYDISKPETLPDPKNIPTPHTRIRMVPAYSVLGYKGLGPKDNPQHWAVVFKDIFAWLLLRACQLSVYVGDGVRVSLNGMVLPVNTPTDLARIQLTKFGNITDGEVFPFDTVITPKDPEFKRFPWRVSILLSPKITKFEHTSIINGVVCSSGSHLTHLRSQFRDAALKNVKKFMEDKELKIKPADICNQMILVVSGPLPGADWTGQRKDELSVPSSLLTHYTFSPSWLSDVAQHLTALYLEKLGKKTRKGKKKEDIDKYTEAGKAGQRKGGPVASLAGAEGDSAITLMQAGATLGGSIRGAPDFEYLGLFSLGGVPINAAKQIEKITALDGKSEYVLRKKLLEENKRWNALMQALNLDYGKNYVSDVEFNTLHYKEFIFCFDADVDGAGKIAGIMLTNIFTFWPALLQRGFVKWFMTPVIRLYPKTAKTDAQKAKVGPIKEFYLESEFHSWIEDPAGAGCSEAELSKRFEVIYYKGLGSHAEFEQPRMFEDFFKRLYTFTLDDMAPEMFATYFGKDTAPRKAELSKPQEELTPQIANYLHTTRTVPCTIQMKMFAKAFKLDAMERQLPGALDSFTTGRRKAFAGARKRFNHGHGKCQTFQLAGYVADQMAYHHGDQSMKDNITRMCQTFPGARVLPFLIGSGSFGTQIKGGKDAANARYTKVSLNVDLCKAMFPPEDDWILNYEFVDGERAEPKSYVPVICCTVLDNMEVPSEGWNYRCWARCPSQVIAITRAYCDPTHPGHAIMMELMMPDSVPSAAGKTPEQRFAQYATAFPLTVGIPLPQNFRMVGEKLLHFGRYELHVAPGDAAGAKGARITITELPFRYWSSNVEKMLRAKDEDGNYTEKAQLVKKVRDNSGKTKIKVVVDLQPGALATIQGKYGSEGIDPIEAFLGLYSGFTSGLNLIRPVKTGHGELLEFGENYHAVVSFHLGYRQQLYEKRFKRKYILVKLKIRLEEEILRYIELTGTNPELKISSIVEHEGAARKILAEHKFPRIHQSKIKQPGFSSLKELEACVVEAVGGEISSAEEEEDVKPTYNYILNLRERDLIKTAYAKREQKLAKLREEMTQIEGILQEKPFPAASVWLQEINTLERVLANQGPYM